MSRCGSWKEVVKGQCGRDAHRSNKLPACYSLGDQECERAGKLAACPTPNMPMKPIAIAALLFVPAVMLRADDPGVEFFEKKIRPVLVEHCYECHSSEAKKLGGKLLLDTATGCARGANPGRRSCRASRTRAC